MGRRVCKGNYVFNVKVILSYTICCRFRLSYYSIYNNKIMAKAIIHLTYIIY